MSTEIADAGGTEAADSRRHGVPLFTLTAMVVGSMVGAGVFSLPRNFALHTGVYGAVIAWVIAGSGMLMLAFVFQTLAVRKPDLDSGVYAYAKAGFGEYLGFFSAFGYWASACVGNVTYWVLIGSTLGLVFDQFGSGDTVLSIVVSSVGVWLFYALVLRGVEGAAAINKIVTVAKVVPIIVFVVIVAFAIDRGTFSANLWGSGDHSASELWGQVRGTMLATVFVFLGVEGATVYSRHARRREDVGKATVTGFLGVLALFAAVSILSFGVLSRPDIADLQQPSMAGVLESVVGHWGKGFVSIGLVISVLGAYLAWTMMAAEVLYVAAKDWDMPRFLSRTNRFDAPQVATLATTILIQIVLVVTYFSDDAFTFTLELCSALSLIPYMLAAAYALKLGVTRETYEHDAKARNRQALVAGLATFYTVFLLYAAGTKFLLLSCVIYAPGTILFVMARREKRQRLFSPAEAAIFAAVTLGAIVGVVGLAVGYISI